MSASLDLNVIAPLHPPDTTELPTVTDELLSDLWIGVVLAAMVLSCVGCLCSCFLYHTFRQWQTRLDNRNLEAGGYDTASLPSYTTVAGLPTYDEAMEQQMLSSSSLPFPNIDASPPPFSKLSVGEFLEIYREDVKK